MILATTLMNLMMTKNHKINSMHFNDVRVGLRVGDVLRPQHGKTPAEVKVMNSD